MARLTLGIAVFVLGCGKVADGPKSGQASSDSATAFVAASTRDAIREVADAFTKKHGSEVKLHAAAASKLAMQIVQGAPADLFLPANQEWADYVREKGLVQETRLLLGNTLVLVVPKGNPAGITRPADLTKLAVKRLALAGPSVPVGNYGRQALKKLGLWDDLEKQKKVASGDDVRVTLTYVERGEAEAGIVYATDARVTDKVEVVYTFDPGTHDPIRYPLVLLKAGAAHKASRLFYEFLGTPGAAEIFKKHGFTLPAGH